MKKREIVNISRLRGLWGKFILRLIEINKKDSWIDWANVYEKQCRGFSLKKQDIRENLFVLRDLGLIELSPAGIKLNFEVQNG
jgi:hypothetical protein